MTIRQAALLLLFTILCPSLCPAQKPAPAVYNLVVSCSCSDTVGKAYARLLRDEIAKSPRYTELADTPANRKKALTLSIVSVAIGDDHEGNATLAAFAIAFVFDGAFISNYVQTCGIKATEQCSQEMLDSVDELFNK